MRQLLWMGALIVIEGNNITVDFNNAVLKGSNLKRIPMNFLVWLF
jgi:hypothetical protein